MYVVQLKTMSIITALSIKDKHKQKYNTMRCWLNQKKISMGDFMIECWDNQFNEQLNKVLTD